ncbi:hypothetical protein XBJ2_1250038 [Xenorhabdus bovienii str. Jollieti]|uniref:Uncharacterized protein n=1 Tax=Xenorhabdus bovienii (strain SS-2004) TaxID=406818 RepID=D3V1B5_XENBS|nr:hypothetical protein XBJ1_2333 [Xenorhabdus bovienii SS-2004]CDH27240.1 hypothetical protein XBJ2_1250038 [Xenorhabdus bovienii str. Jollieti]
MNYCQSTNTSTFQPHLRLSLPLKALEAADLQQLAELLNELELV